MTDYLFAQPSFLSGAARVFDMGATLDDYNTSPTGEYADAVALLNDFRAIGSDLVAAMGEAETTPAPGR
jgi:hypothetical protein